MASKLGENIQREWDTEPRAVELREAHRALKSDRAAGLTLLANLANSGSALAMMYLGHAYSASNGDENEVALGSIG